MINSGFMINFDLAAKLQQVSLPTLGHFLEHGFCPPEIHLVTPAAKLIGVAATVRVIDNDAWTVNEALLALRPGEVLCIDLGDDLHHAPIGAVTRAVALAQGAAGIVVDGPVTDLADLRAPDRHGHVLPVFARGTTCLTTKRRHAGLGRLGDEVSIAGTPVSPGDIVLGDENGLVILPHGDLLSIIDEALASDAAEPGLLAAIERGDDLRQLLI